MKTRPLLGVALLGSALALALSACGPSSLSGVSPTPAGSSLAAPHSAVPATPSPSASDGSTAGPAASSTATAGPSVGTGEPSVSLGETNAKVTLYGSSSCPPEIESSAVTDGVLTIKLVDPKGAGACTADLAPHEFTVEIKAEEITSIRSAVYSSQGVEHPLQLLR